MTTILDGKALGQRILNKVKARIDGLVTKPGLAVILVGEDPASHLYVSLKRQACEEVGVTFELLLYSEDVSSSELANKIRELNTRTDIHGILVQLPLPSQDTNLIISSIHPNKDVDGFHPENLERLRAGKPAIASAVALGVMRLIRSAVPEGVLPPKATIVASTLFAEPLTILLTESNVHVTVVQAENTQLKEHTLNADILIVAEGIPGLITKEMVKPGAIVIDVGTTRTQQGLRGDVDASVETVAGALTPVPGGVGPMTVAMLLVNILKAYELQRGK